MYSISVCAGFMYVFCVKMSVVKSGISISSVYPESKQKKKNNHGKQMEVLLFLLL